MKAARMHYGWVVLALMVLAVFGSLGLGRFGYTSLLPAMQESLALSNTQTGELQSCNLLGYMLAVVLAGLLAARYGPRLVIAISLLVTASAMALTGLLPTFEGVRLGRYLAGLGGAGGNVPAMALVSSWFARRRRGMAAGVAVAGSSVGLMVAGPLIPAIREAYGAQGWRIGWYVLGALTLGVFVLCAVFLRNRPEDMGLRPLGLTEAERRLPETGRSVLDWASVYRSRTLWHLAAIYFAFGFSYIIYSTFFIRYLVNEGGFAKATAGWLWLKIGLVSVISGFIWGGISDRWGRKAALLGVFILQGGSFLVMGLGRGWLAAYLSASLFAITAWSIPALMAALVGDLFGARLAPAALGLITTVLGLGQALGPYLAGRLADLTHSFAPAFVTAGLVALILGAGGSLMLPAIIRDKIPGNLDTK